MHNFSILNAYCEWGVFLITFDKKTDAYATSVICYLLSDNTLHFWELHETLFYHYPKVFSDIVVLYANFFVLLQLWLVLLYQGVVLYIRISIPQDLHRHLHRHHCFLHRHHSTSAISPSVFQ